MPIAADRMNRLVESQTLALAAKVRQLKAQGLEVYSFTLGEPDFDTPDHIRTAAIEAIRRGETHYPPVAGIPPLRQAVADFYQREFGLRFPASQVLISTGAKQSLINVLMSLVNPGQEVILPTPYWVSYLPMTLMCEGTPVFIEAKDENSLKITPEQLEGAITPHTKLFLFNSPSNPTGAVYTEAETEALVQVLEKHPHVYILADEIYALIRFGCGYKSIASYESIRDRVILINGVSKAFAMTGWRIGVTIAVPEIIQLCERFQGQVTSGACSISQHAAATAFASPLEPTYEMVKAFQARRDEALRIFAHEMPDVRLSKPEGAFYLYPNVSAYFGKKTPNGHLIENADQLAEYLVERVRVVTVPGTAFGTNQHIRLSYACAMEDLTKGLIRMAEGLHQLR
jgi:aspartate aminotransferase